MVRVFKALKQQEVPPTACDNVTKISKVQYFRPCVSRECFSMRVTTYAKDG